MRTAWIILLIILAIPAAQGITAEKQEYLPGELIHLSTAGGPLIVETPTGSYTLLGSSTEVHFPAGEIGTYRFIDDTGTAEVNVKQAKLLYLRTARGSSTINAMDTAEGMEVAIPGFDRVMLKDTRTQEIRITPNLGKRWGFERTFAVDPTVPGFGTAELTITATGSALYKCVDYDYLSETCNGPWRFMRPLTPGQQYTISVHGADPAFGEGDSESQPDTCTFSDDTGAGDGDTNVDCLTEVTTQNSGITADLTDPEQGGGPSQIDIRFQNSLSVASVNSVNVTYRYQRVTNTQVAGTTASIQVLDGGSWTTACTDTVSIGSWETYTCPLGTWVTTQAEANDVQTRIQFDTAKSGQGSSFGTVYVDYSYLALDYVYNDIFEPTYSNIAASPASPKTYDATSSSFSTDWTDDTGVTLVYIEHNFTGTWQNTSVTGGPTYSHAQTLGAGTYSWRQLARDADANWNETMAYQTYTVDKASGAVELYLNGTRGNLVIDEDQSITLTGTRAAGETDMTLTENGSVIATGTSISLPRNYNTPETYELTLTIPATQNYTADTETWTLTVNDITPPGQITGLANISEGTSWILWSWTNPADSDFSHVSISINGTWHANTSANSHNVTGLDSDTLYEAQIITADNSGNINGVAVTDLGRTETSNDVTPPVISDVQSSGVQDSQATITWNTDEPSDSLVRYGTSSGSYTLTASSSPDVMSHSITLASLSPSTTYYYVVNSSDPSGNSAQSTENSFTTTADTTPPKYGTYSVSPPSASTYPQTIIISINWTDNGNLGTVSIEHNFTGTWQNETMSGGPLTYTYSRALAAGSYSWRSHAIDAASNRNLTMPLQQYIVTRRAAQVNLLINGVDADTSADEDVSVNLTAQMITGEGTLEILQNASQLDASTGTPLTHIKVFETPETYSITVRMNQTENYTSATETHLLSINDKTPPAVTLVDPPDGKTDTDGQINFTYTVLDNVRTASCGLYINGTLDQTKTDINDGATNWFSQTFSDDDYVWTVECSDADDNSANASATYLFHVTIINPWVPTTATHSVDGTVTSLVNNSEGTTTRLDTGEIVTVTTWSDTAPSNANISAVDASCEIDSATRGARLYFQYATGGAWSGDLCPGPQDGVGTFTCDLYAQGIDTVTELNSLDVRCVIRDNDGGPSAWATLDYMQLQPSWTLIELPDFQINSTGLHFPIAPKEGEATVLYANVSNEGTVGSTATVLFYDATRSQTIGTSSMSIPSGEVREFNNTWNAVLGSTNITVIVDNASLVEEMDETNNEAYGWINVSSTQTYYGLTMERWFALSDGMSYKYNWTDAAVSGNIFAMDVDASSTLLNLQALTRDAIGNYDFTDLAQADAQMGQGAFNDNINSTYSAGGALIGTQTFTVFGVDIADVPVVNSTVTESFVTGILWDVDDDTNGGYDGEEDLVFVTRVNMSAAGAYGNYDFEIRIPALLRADKPGSAMVELFIEII